MNFTTQIFKFIVEFTYLSSEFWLVYDLENAEENITITKTTTFEDECFPIIYMY